MESASSAPSEKGNVDDRTNWYRLTERGQREIDARRDWEDQYLTVEG